MSNSLLSTLIYKQAERYGDNVVLKYRDYEAGQWLPVSWKQFAEKVKLASNALVALGVEAQENVGVFSQNMPSAVSNSITQLCCNFICQIVPVCTSYRNLITTVNIRISNTDLRYIDFDRHITDNSKYRLFTMHGTYQQILLILVKIRMM